MAKNLETNVFDEALSKLGFDIATMAAQHEQDSTVSWERVRTLFTLAQGVGAQEHAFRLLFGETYTNAKKALWFRRQKRLLSEALKLGIRVEDGISMQALENVVKQAREEIKSPEEKERDSLKMLERSAKGTLTHATNRDAVVRSLLGTMSMIEKRIRSH